MQFSGDEQMSLDNAQIFLKNLVTLIPGANAFVGE